PTHLYKVSRVTAASTSALSPFRDISIIVLDGEDAQPVPMIRGSESKIRQVIVNLAGNAVRHTPEHAAIEFAVGVVGLPEDADADSGDADDGQATAKGQNGRSGARNGAKERTRERGFVTGGVRIFRRGDSAGNDQADAQEPEGIVPDVTAAGSITVDDSLRGFPNGRVRF